MKTSWMVLGLAVAVATAACGDDTSGTGGSGGSGSGGDDAGSTGGSTGDTTSTGQGQGGGGTGGGGTGGGGTGGEAPTGPSGEVSIGVYNFLPDTPGTLLVATFGEEPRCERLAAEGACELLLCASGPSLDAGPLALSGGDLPAALALGDGAYLEDLDGALVASGDVVAVVGAGTAQVPAFELGATTPATATLTAPDLTGATIASSADLAVAWTGGDGEARVTIDGPSDEENRVEMLRCIAPAADGQLTVPAGILGQMTPGDVFFSLRVVGHDEVTVDDWTFDLTVGAYAAAADGINGDAFAFFALE